MRSTTQNTACTVARKPSEHSRCPGAYPHTHFARLPSSHVPTHSMPDSLPPVCNACLNPQARPHHHRTSSSGMTTTTTTTACSTGSTPLATLGSSTHLPISRASTGGDTTHHSRLSPFGRRSSASHHAPTSPDPSLLGAPCCTSTPPSPLGPARHHQQQQQDSSQHRGSSSPLHSLQLHHKHSSPSSTADKQLRGSDSPGKGPCPDVAARKVSFDVAANYGLLRPSSLPNVAPHATHQQQAGRDATLGSTKSVVPHHLSFPASVEELERAAEEVVVSLTGSHLVAAAGVGGGGCGAQQQEGKRQQQQQRDADEAAALTGFFAPKKSPRHNNILHK